MKLASAELKENSQRHTNLWEKGRWELKTAIPELKRIVSVKQIYKRKGDGK